MELLNWVYFWTAIDLALVAVYLCVGLVEWARDIYKYGW